MQRRAARRPEAVAAHGPTIRLSDRSVERKRTSEFSRSCGMSDSVDHHAAEQREFRQRRAQSRKIGSEFCPVEGDGLQHRPPAVAPGISGYIGIYFYGLQPDFGIGFEVVDRLRTARRGRYLADRHFRLWERYRRDNPAAADGLSDRPAPFIWALFGIQTMPPDHAVVPPTNSVFSITRTLSPWSPRPQQPSCHRRPRQ